ncbi:hypothetical protein CIB48_g11858 [Xylaria polymorpha]|nr:hypothetical protein CIB48_g11858 [Xylaria polymorpha]
MPGCGYPEPSGHNASMDSRSQDHPDQLRLDVTSSPTIARVNRPMLSVTGEEIGLTVTSPPPSSTPSEYLFDTKCTDLLHQRCVAPIRVYILRKGKVVLSIIRPRGNREHQKTRTENRQRWGWDIHGIAQLNIPSVASAVTTPAVRRDQSHPTIADIGRKDMSRYEGEYPPRGRAADYYAYSTGGGAAAAPPTYPQVASPGHTTYNGKPQARLTYEPLESSYPPRSQSPGLQPRSVPAPADLPRDITRERGDNRHGDSDDSDDGRTRSPTEKAKRFVDSTFTRTSTGLGVGVLGALVGGLAAREAVDLTSNRQHQHKDDIEQHKRNQLIGAMVGAAVGALGANAVEKRIEVRRARDEIKQEKWERKWRRPSGDAEVLEKMEIIARPRSRGFSRESHHHGDRDERDRDRGGRSRSRRGVEREVDPGARSWKNVEDWVLDEGDDGRPRSGRQRSRDSYRH